MPSISSIYSQHNSKQQKTSQINQGNDSPQNRREWSSGWNKLWLGRMPDQTSGSPVGQLRIGGIRNHGTWRYSWWGAIPIAIGWGAGSLIQPNADRGSASSATWIFPASVLLMLRLSLRPLHGQQKKIMGSRQGTYILGSIISGKVQIAPLRYSQSALIEPLNYVI